MLPQLPARLPSVGLASRLKPFHQCLAQAGVWLSIAPNNVLITPSATLFANDIYHFPFPFPLAELTRKFYPAYLDSQSSCAKA
jgi:hypothetical protein